MHSALFRSTFLRVLKFLQIKEWGPNFWGEPIMKKVLFGPRFCISILKVLRVQIHLHYISMHFVWFRSLFLRVFKFLHIKEWGPNFWGKPILQKVWVIWVKFVQIKQGGSDFWVEPILQNVWIIWSSLLYFNFKSFLDPNPLSFIRFQWILHDWGVPFSDFWNLD